MNQRPTIVLVHGAFAESASWNQVIERVYHHATPIVAAHNTLFADIIAIANPLRSVAGDAAYVRDVVAGIGTPVVLVGHSYGGIVITEAAADNDAVVGLVYVNAFAPDTGESAFDLATMFPGSSLAEALVTQPITGVGDELVIAAGRYHEQFAADVPNEQAILMRATQRPVSSAALAEGLPSPVPAWKSTPSWFVFGERDLNIPVAAHRFMAQRAGSKDTRVLLGASHAISVSRPTDVAQTIVDALRMI